MCAVCVRRRFLDRIADAASRTRVMPRVIGSQPPCARPPPSTHDDHLNLTPPVGVEGSVPETVDTLPRVPPHSSEPAARCIVCVPRAPTEPHGVERVVGLVTDVFDAGGRARAGESGDESLRQRYRPHSWCSRPCLRKHATPSWSQLAAYAEIWLTPTTPLPPPSQLAPPVASCISPDLIMLHWQPARSNGSLISGYTLRGRPCDDKSEFQVVYAGNLTSFVVTSIPSQRPDGDPEAVEPAKNYQFDVCAHNAVGSSSTSSPAAFLTPGGRSAAQVSGRCGAPNDVDLLAASRADQPVRSVEQDTPRHAAKRLLSPHTTPGHALHDTTSPPHSPPPHTTPHPPTTPPHGPVLPHNPPRHASHDVTTSPATPPPTHTSPRRSPCLR